MRKLMSLVLSLLLVVMPMTAMAEVGGTTTRSIPVFSDMPNNWSTEALLNAVKNGLLTGFDGKIMPMENLTRAQMATIINRAFGATELASLEEFQDVKQGDWFYEEMAKAVAMGTFLGDGNRLNPNDPITREQAFVVIARALKLQSSNVVPEGLSDLDNISDWAKGEVYALINAGYISGSNGLLNPSATITRAEFAQVMYNTVKTYLNAPNEYTGVFQGNVMINGENITLKDVTINGDLIIGEGVGVGTILLENVVITGRLVVRSPESSNVNIKGTSEIDEVVGSVTYEDVTEPVKKPEVDKEDESEVSLRLRSASMGDAAVDIDGNIINVTFDLGEAPGTIKAVFNKSVRLTEISTEKTNNIDFDEVESTVESELPNAGYTLTMPIATVITENHLEFFGDKVYVTVRDNDGQSLRFTIKLIGR